MSRKFITGIFLLVLILAILWMMEPQQKEIDKDFIDIEESEETVETIKINLYFFEVINGQERIVEVEREISVTTDIAEKSIEELLKGPLSHEKKEGFLTLINEDTVLQSIEIKNGVAFVDFNEKLEEGVASSAWVTAIRSQIEKTLAQFEAIDSVIISINGRIEDVLQP